MQVILLRLWDSAAAAAERSLKGTGRHLAAVLVFAALSQLPTTALGQFQIVENTGLPSVLESGVAWGDYDQDGYLDLLITGMNVPPDTNYQSGISRIYKNNGNGTFSDINAGLMGTSYGSAAWLDYDNDGDLDVLIGGTDTLNVSVTLLYRNDGGGTFTLVEGTPFHGSAYGGLAVGDYNNDGYVDVILSAFDLAGPITKLYRNNGDGTFAEVTTAVFQGVNGHSRLVWGDYDNDGYRDLLLCGRTQMNWTEPQPVTKLYHNNRGDGTFTEVTAANFPGVSRGTVDFGDYNNDGYLDVAVSGLTTGLTDGGRDTTVIFRNEQGTGVFTDIHAAIPGARSVAAQWGDYDADGRLDLLMEGYGTNSGLFRNENDTTFAEAALAGPELGGGGVAWGDINGDGYLDAVVTGLAGGGGADSTILYLNVTPGTDLAYYGNTPPAAPTGLAATVTDSTVHFRWNRTTDAETPTSALSYNLWVGTSPTAVDIFSPMAAVDTSATGGYRRVVRMGSANLDSSWTLTGLANGTYHWSVQAVDNAFTGGPFAATGTFTVGEIPPTIGKVRLNVKVLLQGAYKAAGDTMARSLQEEGLLAQQFPGRQIPSMAVDSITLEIRDSLTTGASHDTASVPAWLLSDGSVVAFDDSTRSYVEFDSVTVAPYYIVVRHRNHLAIMSSAPMALATDTAMVYDFTTGQDKAHGSEPMVAVGTRFAMAAGDANGSGGVNASDLNGFWRPQNGTLGYLSADFDLSGGVNATDRNTYWRRTNGLVSQVP